MSYINVWYTILVYFISTTYMHIVYWCYASVEANLVCNYIQCNMYMQYYISIRLNFNYKVQYNFQWISNNWHQNKFFFKKKKKKYFWNNIIRELTWYFGLPAESPVESLVYKWKVSPSVTYVGQFLITGNESENWGNKPSLVLYDRYPFTGYLKA